MADITMPQLGETVTEGTITKWFKNVGDQVAEDEPLFEVSTDKVDSEVPAPASGYLVEIRVPEGETVDVGEVLAVVGDAPPGDGDGADAGEADQEQASAAPSGAEHEPQPQPEAETPAEAPPEPEPQAQQPEPQPEPQQGETEQPESAPSPAARSGGDGRLLSPVVRRLVAEHGLDPDQIDGTGVGGRITRNDVLAAAERGGAGAAPAASEARAQPAPAPSTPSASARPAPAPAVPPARPGERDTTVPHTNIRRRTAEHMIRSKQTSAHVYASIEVDYEAVDRVRRAEKEQFRTEEGFGLTYLPFVFRAVVDAIREFPQVNASFTDDALIVHNYVNLGVAVDLDYNGLMVPVIRDSDTKRMRALAREVRDLAERARSKQLTPDDISGGTFTITNPGPAGTLMTLPVINQPQVAILSTDGVKRRPVAVEQPDGSEAIAIHSVGNIALTWDHRAFDGMYASNFLAAIREALETRDWAAELS
jgi:pyruvate dehydrogenase E2 component (dihydrolipoamide acetyltransferase)